MNIKKSLFFLSLVSLCANAEPSTLSELLTPEKAEIIKSKQLQEERLRSKNATSWISDINLQMSDSYTPEDQRETKINLLYEQPIYRWGNIYREIELSDKQFEMNNMIIDRQKEMYLYGILDSIFMIKGLELKENTISLSLDKNKIELKRKKELYENGTLDITFISDMLIQQNDIKNQKVEVESNIKIQKELLKAKSRFKYEELLQRKELFMLVRLMSKSDYMERNYINIDKKSVDMTAIKSKIASNSMWPVLSVNANAYDTRDNLKNKNIFIEDDGVYGGFKITMPLSINLYKNKEFVKAQELTQRDEYENKFIEQEVFYDAKIREISAISDKIDNLKDTINEYEKLLNVSRRDLKLGLKISAEVEILEINKQLKESQMEEYLNQIRQKTMELVKNTSVRS